MEPHVNNLIILFVVLPMAAGIVTTLLRGHLGLQRLAGLTALLSIFTLSIFLLRSLGDGAGLYLSMMGDWKAPFGIAVVFDGMSGVLLCTAQVVAIACYIHSFSVLDQRIERGWYHPLFHLLMMGVNYSFLTGDLFNLFVAFEIMLMASYAMMCLGASRKQLSQAYKYVILNLIGSTIFVLGAGLIYGMVGTLNYADLARFVAESRVHEQPLPYAFNIVSVMLLMVFALKGAVFPLWFWLPDTYHTMPTSIAGLFAALLSKVGVYAVLRLYPMVFATPGLGEQTTLMVILAAGAVMTMIVAIIGAVAAGEIRRILSLILISHVGFLIFGIAMMSPAAHSATLFYMVQEMIVITLLFLCCGMIERHTGTDDLRKLGDLVKRTPWLATFFFLGAMTMIGIPPLAGFHGKFLLVVEGFNQQRWIATAVLLVAAFFTLVAMLKIWSYCFWSPAKSKAVAVPQGAVAGSRPDMRSAFIAVAILTIASLYLGLGGESVLKFTREATTELTRPEAYVTAVLGPNAWPNKANHPESPHVASLEIPLESAP